MELVLVRGRQPCVSGRYRLPSWFPKQMTEGDHDLVCAQDDGSAAWPPDSATPLAGYRWRARPEANGTNLDLWMPQLKLRRSGHDGRGVEARYARASASFASRTSVARLQS
jgi:hypothetical protein